MQESALIQDFDIGGDAQVDFWEFLLFQTLLSIPMEDIEGRPVGGGEAPQAAGKAQGGRVGATGQPAGRLLHQNSV